jgi:hypothetical protein
MPRPCRRRGLILVVWIYLPILRYGESPKALAREKALGSLGAFGKKVAWLVASA